jgi:ketosteroid isomerase-like protein
MSERRANGASERLAIAKSYEKALFAGRMDEVGGYLCDDVVYWVAGRPPLGGEWRGREAVLRAFAGREFGLGAADWGYQEVWRDWYAADERVIVEIRERSWLASAPDDVMDQRTCVVIRFRGPRICEMRDYTDASLYEAFLARHRAALPKFSAPGAAR